MKNAAMFKKEDKVAAAVSGGKDSLSLLYFLNKHRYNPIAITIDEGIKGYRDETIAHVKKFCSDYDIPLHVFSFKGEYGFTLDEIKKRVKKPICSYCGVLRRDLLNKKGRELGCSKIAIGHNLDDEAQTVLMNFFRGEIFRMARSGPVTGIIRDPFLVPRAKPLRECPERENIIYALINKINYSDIECPYRGGAYRNSVRAILNPMEEKYPGSKFAALRTGDELANALRKNIKDKKPPRCAQCGEIAAGAMCKTCEILAELS